MLVDETHSRPFASNARFIGLFTSGSAVTSVTEKPGGSLNVLACSAGASGSVLRTFCANGSSGGAAPATEEKMRSASVAGRTVFIMSWHGQTARVSGVGTGLVHARAGRPCHAVPLASTGE